jgi:hypothetical protein
MYTPRPLSELMATDDPAWPLVQQWISEAKNEVEVLAPSPGAGAALEAIQVTLRSPMGTITYHTGGLLIDGGWIRILGSGHPRLARTISSWNLGMSVVLAGEPPPFLLIADDVLGGFFALNGGGLGPSPGHVYYHAPDTLRWESLDRGYSDFLLFCLAGDLNQFYDPYRWQGWREDVKQISGNQSLSIYPPLWTKEGKDIERASRRAIPVKEVYELNVLEFPRQLES